MATWANVGEVGTRMRSCRLRRRRLAEASEPPDPAPPSPELTAESLAPVRRHRADSALFNRWRHKTVRIFELGLGTNNPELPSTMGVSGRPGASLRGWRELFPHSCVFGADIDRAILFQSDRIKTFYCDQLSQVAIRDLWSQPDLLSGMDIIIEDGLHTFEANVSFLEGSIEHLRPGGIYVVEDIQTEMVSRWRNQVETVYSKKHQTLVFALVVLPNPLNLVDNNLFIIRRPG